MAKETKDKTIEELKADVYDLLIMQQQINDKLRQANMLIAQKQEKKD